MSGALKGVRVLDLTQMMAGPFCTMLLADQGADVIKIEPPEGEATRTHAPHFADDQERHYGGYFQSINRNKRSICPDLKSQGGKQAFRSHAAGADVEDLTGADKPPDRPAEPFLVPPFRSTPSSLP